MTLDDFLILYPEYNNIPDRVENQLSVSEATVPSSSNTILREDAIGLLTAHILACQYRDMLDIGQIIKETEQGSGIRKDIYLNGDSYYEKTIYGLGYLKILKKLNGGGGSAMFVA